MKKLKLLFIVDDEEMAVMVAKFYCEKLQLAYKIETFANGVEAFTRFKALLLTEEGPPDLILLDLFMPFMDGHSFLAHIAPYNSPSKIVVISSSMDQHDRDQVLAFKNVIAFLDKPIDPPKFQKIVNLLE